MDRNSTRLLVVPALAGISFILTGALFNAGAQTQTDSQAAPAQTQTFTVDQLTDLVAPIALYPDGLLSQVLVASTYPLELVEAQQWLQQNSNLTGTARTEAAKQQSWDPSVQALVAFPDVLSRLNQDIRWTTDLGNAFLAQEGDVMAAVQKLRATAQANGRLESTAQQTVSTETQNGQPAIVIQPANPDVVYVPSYDPNYVWGPPVAGYYPSLYYPDYGFGWGPGINLGLYFGGWGGWGGWGWGPSWFGGTVIVNNNFFHRFGFRGNRNADLRPRPWEHNPNHRLGIPYPNRQLSGRYQSASMASRANLGRFGDRGPVTQPGVRPFQGMRPDNVPNANRMAAPQNRINPQTLRDVPRMSPQGGAARSFPAPQARPMQVAPPNAGGGAGMRGFGGAGRSFGGAPMGGRGFGGGGFGGGHGFGGGGARGGGGRR
jgi:Protein of unknown function (DUF3300)